MAVVQTGDTAMIEVKRSDLIKALELAGCVIGRRNTVPALGAVRVTANGALRIEASDLDRFALAEIDYAGPEREGICLLYPERIRAAMAGTGGETVRIGFADSKAAISTGALELAAATLPGEDHPGFETADLEEFSAELGPDALAALARVMRAVSTEETRYYLNGVVVHRIDEWTWRFAATDGHRLMQVDVPLPGATGAIPDGTIIPRDLVKTVLARFARSREPVRVQFGYRRVVNTPDDTLAPEKKGAPRIAWSSTLGPVRLTLAGRLIDGTFPDYKRVIPAETKYAVRIARGVLQQAIATACAIDTGKVRAVRIAAVAGGGVRLSCRSPELGEGTVTVPAQHTLPTGYEIGFSGQYLLDCLASLSGDEVDLRLNEKGDPAVIVDPADTAFLCVLMPMRV